MKIAWRICLILFCVMPLVSAQTLYNKTPDWISGDTQYSTGGALADINGDGYLDIVVSNGNDMAKEPLAVYYNRKDGTFPSYPSWQAQDKTYNGHLDVADVNGDGWMDVAVCHLLDSTAGDSAAKLYLNNNGTLSSLPDWSSTEKARAFGVAFGDMNNDGRPDLAVATGWAYSPTKYYKNYVYLNVNGQLSSTASWKSSDSTTDQGVLWVDGDRDGWLDLVCTGAKKNSRLYRNLGGMLDVTHAWSATDNANQDAIMITAGDVTGDGIGDLIITDNKQLAGGQGPIRLYRGLATGYFTTTPVWKYNSGYGSAVGLADMDTDGDLDLATGAWWDNTDLFFNLGTGFGSSPDWSSQLTSVVEKIVFGDVDPSAFTVKEFKNVFSPSGSQQLFYLSRRQIQGVKSVVLDGVVLSPSQYVLNREFGWITVYAPPTISLEVTFSFSSSLDMVVTNWDSHKGNYLYYNQLPPSWFKASPDSISASTGGVSNLSLAAGPENAGRNYLVFGGISGSSPGVPLPGNVVILPINWDIFTNIVLNNLGSPAFVNFVGSLDSSGEGNAMLNIPGPIPSAVGITFTFAYAMDGFVWDFASNPVDVDIIP